MADERILENLDKIVQWLFVIFCFVIAFIVSIPVSIDLAIKYDIYILLAIILWLWIEFITEVFLNEKLKNSSFKNLKIHKLINRYPYSIKMALQLIMIITFLLTIKFKAAVIVFLSVYIFYLKFKNVAFKKEKKV